MKRQSAFRTCAVLTLLLLLLRVPGYSQSQSYFINPLDGDLLISGSFGEPRDNHFHTGIDFTTRKKMNLPVHAAASGYVSRIKVSSVGYGNAIYITHPNGYMTVYGHLDHFNEAIQKYVRKKQYEQQSFEVELYPDKSLFPFKQGDVVAYSGNTGGSTAPHLHFEVRDATGETSPVNPLAYGVKVGDKVAPKIQSLALYPLEECCGRGEPVMHRVSTAGDKSFISPDTLISEYKKFSFGIQAGDWMNGSDNDGDFGIYSLEMLVDGKSVYAFKMNRLEFSEGRYANCLIDYEKKKTQSRQLYRTYLLAGNKAGIFTSNVNRGVIDLAENQLHSVTIIAKDYFGNSTTLNFFVKYRKLGKSIASGYSYGPAKLFTWNQQNTYNTDSVKIYFPANILYDDFYFNSSKDYSPGKNIYSSIYAIGDALTPLHNNFTVSILPWRIPDELKSKAIIVLKGRTGSLSAKTTSWDGSYLKAQSKDMGRFMVMIDNTAPVITPINVKPNQLVAIPVIRIKMTDNLSGITKYNGYLDGKWTLMEYDAKNDVLSWDVEKDMAKGEHSLKIVVEDKVNNKSTYTLKFKL